MTQTPRRVTLAACALALTGAWLISNSVERPVAAQQAPPAQPAGGARPAAAAAAPAPAGVTPLDILPVQGNVHMIAGDGGNIAVQIGPDAVVLVDAGAGKRSADVIAAIKTLTDRPATFILNTSGHADHVGGNGEVAASGQELGGGGRGGGGGGAVGGVRTGASRISHENVLLYMAKPTAAGTSRFPEANWPTEAFITKKNLYMNGEGIQMIHVPAAYSDGDSIVFFRRSDVIATGAIVDSEGFPRIDLQQGGSLQGVVDVLNQLVDLAIPPTPLAYQKGGTYIIPGHGRVMDQPDIVAYRDMATIIRDTMKEMIAKKMTLEQIRAANPTKGYTRRYGSTSGAWTTNMFIDAAYASLTKGGNR